MPDNFFRSHEKKEIFGNHHPLEIDLGCGDGSFLLDMAEHFPERNFLGVERLLGRVRHVCRGIQERGLKNVKVLRLESQYTLEYLLVPGSISRLHLLCPDPWPKVRHHKNRIVQQNFLHILKKALSADGEFLFKTDHPGYYEWVCEEMKTFGDFTPLPWPEAKEEGGFFYPKTDFQRHWENQGKEIFRLRFSQ
ncbi:MAG: tRNA (guanosine(46)-N7)-methyltransferase TrmB [Akkermansiaceae bacterium]